MPILIINVSISKLHIDSRGGMTIGVTVLGFFPALTLYDFNVLTLQTQKTEHTHNVKSSNKLIHKYRKVESFKQNKIGFERQL